MTIFERLRYSLYLAAVGGAVFSLVIAIAAADVVGWCVFRLMVDRVSTSTWTWIPAQRGQNSGVMVDSFWSELQ
jgi:hypothetical protein